MLLNLILPTVDSSAMDLAFMPLIKQSGFDDSGPERLRRRPWSVSPEDILVSAAFGADTPGYCPIEIERPLRLDGLSTLEVEASGVQGSGPSDIISIGFCDVSTDVPAFDVP